MITGLDPQSRTWLVVSGWARQRLKATRELNDEVGHNDTATAVLRGRIQALKWLLELGDEEGHAPPKIHVEPTPEWGEPANG